MTTYTAARDAIASYVETAWAGSMPTVKLFFENTLQIDLDRVGVRFVSVEINFTDTLRQGVDQSPISRSWGEISFRIFVKEGNGTRLMTEVEDAIAAMLKYRLISGVQLDCPAPGKKIIKDGWTSHELNIPFSFWQ